MTFRQNPSSDDEHSAPKQAQHDLLDSLPTERVSPLDEKEGIFQSPTAIKQLGSYRLIELIGEGGMGVVWRAEQSEPVQRAVAVKVVKRGIDSKEILTRFEAERQALALMNHPNIARILDAGTTPEGQPFFAMELVHGKSLTNYCDERRFGIQERLKLFVDVCNGVQHAHQKGIIHRDLKPSNILVSTIDNNPVPKVIDFGLAKATENSRRLTDHSLFTELGQILGTLKYMSPEQANLNSREVDTRSDVYALGVVLYELLTGRTPIGELSMRDLSIVEVLDIIRQEVPRKPSKILETCAADEVSTIVDCRSTDRTRLSRVLTGDLDWIVMKALEKDVDRRYQSASDFAADVLRYLNREPVVARPPSVLYRVEKFVSKHRVPVLAASLVFVALVVGLLVTTSALLRALEAEGLAASRLSETNKAKETAERNLTFAKKGNEILGSVFSQLDPGAQYSTVSSLRDALSGNLEKAAEQLRGDSIGDVQTMADMQMILGKSLVGLGKAENAIPLLKAAREALESSTGIDSSETLGCMSSLGICYLEAGKLEEARSLLEEAYERTKHVQVDDRTRLVCMNNLGGVYQALGKLPLAVPLWEQAHELMKLHLGENDPNTLSCTNNLLMAYSQMGKVESALPLLEDKLELMQLEFGEDDPETLKNQNNLAMAYRAAGRLESAISLLEKTLKLSRARLGEDKPSTLNHLNNLALCLLDSGQAERALPLFKDALRLTEQIRGKDHQETLVSMNNLARNYQVLGKLELAEPLLEETRDLCQKKLGPEHNLTINCLNNLAMGYRAKGNLELAAKTFEDAARGAEKQNYAIDNVSRVLGETIYTLDMIKEYDRADSWRQKWQSYVRELRGEESPEFAGELASYGQSLVKREDYIKAEPVLRRCLSIRQSIQPDSWTTFNIQSMLGKVLMEKATSSTEPTEKEKQMLEAEALMVAGFEGMKAREKSIPPFAASRIPESLDRLVELYTRIGNTTQSEEYAKLRARYSKNEAKSE